MLPRGGEFLIWLSIGKKGSCVVINIRAHDQGWTNYCDKCEFLFTGLELPQIPSLSNQKDGTELPGPNIPNCGKKIWGLGTKEGLTNIS